MNDDTRLEQLLADGLQELAPQHAPDRLRIDISTETGNVRPRTRWLALLKEPPMRIHNRTTVGSPTARVAAIMAATLMATLLVVSAGIAGSRLLASHEPIIVDPSGNADFETITAAVVEAQHGDEIRVRPGTYAEAILIDKDIVLRGDGPVDEIVITAPDDGPLTPIYTGAGTRDPYAILVRDADPTIEGLTFSGTGSEVVLDGGSPTLRGSVFESVGSSYSARDRYGGDLTANSILATGGGTPLIADNDLHESGAITVLDGSSPTIARNTLSGGTWISLADLGHGTTVSGNVIQDAIHAGIGGWDSANVAVIEDNVVADPGAIGVDLSRIAAAVLNNEVRGAGQFGIVVGRTPATVAGNTLTDNRIGISYASDGGTISENDVIGGSAGIVIVAGDSEVRGNDIEGAANRGIAIVDGSPVLRDNRACGNGQDLYIAPAAGPDIDASNVTCEDLALE